VQALLDPHFYPHAPATVEHRETHISHVFLAGRYVYKLKKAVRLPFVDFSTLALRTHFCHEEVRLNRRLCPEVYLGVVPITHLADGSLRLDGEGDAVEHLVWMHRLPEDGMLPHALAAGRITTDLLEEFARTLVAFHAAVPVDAEVTAQAQPEVLRARWDEEIAALGAGIPELLPAEDHAVLADFGPTFLIHHETVLRARLGAGRIREGHGDLHGGNVCLVETPPPPAGLYAFDCLEFSRALRSTDVAAEVAFLTMDLEARGYPELAGTFARAYAEAAADADLPNLLPFYAAQRALIRAKVDALRLGQPDCTPAERADRVQRARQHLALAVRYAWASGAPVVIAVSGLSGTGKSALATALGDASGFAVVSTDSLRSRRGSGPEVSAVDQGRYAPAARAAVYIQLATEVDAHLAAGRSVVADATFLQRGERERLQHVARTRSAAVMFVECHADEDTVRGRLEGRERRLPDAPPPLTDARWDTYVAQRRHRDSFAANEPHRVVDTSANLAAARSQAIRLLWPWRQGRRVAEVK